MIVIYTWEKLRSFISEKLRHEAYIVQPYINCKTKNGQAYDFRLHVQKNEENKWIITTIYPNDSHRAAVLEYGMAFPGAITQHCEYIQPNIGVITNVGLAHIGNFDGDVNLLAKAKSELIFGMNPTGKLYINADDKNSRLLSISAFKGEIVTVGIDRKAAYMARDIAYKNTGISFRVVLDNKEH